MIYLDTAQLYYSNRKYFRDHIIDSLPNNETDWYNGYRSWLAEQGCEIVRPQSDKDIVVDILGVASGYDKFSFQQEEDAVMFVLKYSN